LESWDDHKQLYKLDDPVLTLVAGTNSLKAFALNLGGYFSITNSVSFVSSNTFLLQLTFHQRVADDNERTGFQPAIGQLAWTDTFKFQRT